MITHRRGGLWGPAVGVEKIVHIRTENNRQTEERNNTDAPPITSTQTRVDRQNIKILSTKKNKFFRGEEGAVRRSQFYHNI